MEVSDFGAQFDLCYGYFVPRAGFYLRAVASPGLGCQITARYIFLEILSFQVYRLTGTRDKIDKPHLKATFQSLPGRQAYQREEKPKGGTQGQTETFFPLNCSFSFKHPSSSLASQIPAPIVAPPWMIPLPDGGTAIMIDIEHYSRRLVYMGYPPSLFVPCIDSLTLLHAPPPPPGGEDTGQLKETTLTNKERSDADTTSLLFFPLPLMVTPSFFLFLDNGLDARNAAGGNLIPKTFSDLNQLIAISRSLRQMCDLAFPPNPFSHGVYYESFSLWFLFLFFVGFCLVHTVLPCLSWSFKREREAETSLFPIWRCMGDWEPIFLDSSGVRKKRLTVALRSTWEGESPPAGNHFHFVSEGNQGWDIEKSGTSHSAISSLNSPTAVRMRHCFIIFLHNLLTPLLCSMRHARVYFGRLSSANYDSAGDPFRRTTDTHYLSTGYRCYQLSARLMYNPATGEHSCFFLRILLQGSLSRNGAYKNPQMSLTQTPSPVNPGLTAGRWYMLKSGSPAQNENEQKIRDISSSAHPNLIEQHQWLLLPNYKHQAQKGTTNFSSPSLPHLRIQLCHSRPLPLPAPEINRHLISSRTVHGYRATPRTEYVRSFQRITVNINKAFKVKPPISSRCPLHVRRHGTLTLDHQANLSRSYLYLVYIQAHDNISARSRSFIRRPWTCHLHRLRVSALISIYAGTLLQLSNNAHPCLETEPQIHCRFRTVPAPKTVLLLLHTMQDGPALPSSGCVANVPIVVLSCRRLLELAIVKTETTLGSFPPSHCTNATHAAHTQTWRCCFMRHPSLSALSNSISPTYSFHCPSLGLFAVEGRVGPRHLYGFEQIPRQRLTATNSQSHPGDVLLVGLPLSKRALYSSWSRILLVSAPLKALFDDFSFAKLEHDSPSPPLKTTTPGTGTDTKPATCCFSVHLSDYAPHSVRKTWHNGRGVISGAGTLLTIESFLGTQLSFVRKARQGTSDFCRCVHLNLPTTPNHSPVWQCRAFVLCMLTSVTRSRQSFTGSGTGKACSGGSTDFSLLPDVETWLSFTTRGPSPAQSPSLLPQSSQGLSPGARSGEIELENSGRKGERAPPSDSGNQGRGLAYPRNLVQNRLVAATIVVFVDGVRLILRSPPVRPPMRPRALGRASSALDLFGIGESVWRRLFVALYLPNAESLASSGRRMAITQYGSGGNEDGEFIEYTRDRVEFLSPSKGWINIILHRVVPLIPGEQSNHVYSSLRVIARSRAVVNYQVALRGSEGRGIPAFYFEDILQLGLCHWVFILDMNTLLPNRRWRDEVSAARLCLLGGGLAKAFFLLAGRLSSKFTVFVYLKRAHRANPLGFVKIWSKGANLWVPKFHYLPFHDEHRAQLGMNIVKFRLLYDALSPSFLRLLNLDWLLF
ncbi:hypothetical protein CCUS01_16867 [Colletotrichum cuscutae]|uniref:Uncharacterized protein n=1 Tax=Colletotrichum cuscutae TaxID=1209917 RepID=A0AAI9Y637_9PEZI|nr:hypothetical protein CCUS01_16867 [Colletotrichum cuscutae]